MLFVKVIDYVDCNEADTDMWNVVSRWSSTELSSLDLIKRSPALFYLCHFSIIIIIIIVFIIPTIHNLDENNF